MSLERAIPHCPSFRKTCCAARELVNLPLVLKLPARSSPASSQQSCTQIPCFPDNAHSSASLLAALGPAASLHHTALSWRKQQLQHCLRTGLQIKPPNTFGSSGEGHKERAERATSHPELSQRCWWSKVGRKLRLKDTGGAGLLETAGALG